MTKSPRDRLTYMTSSRLLHRLTAGLLALVSAAVPVHAAVAKPVPPATRVAGKHMLFKVRGPNGATVYLLGSVHLLTPEAGKLPAEVDSAFSRAKIVAFETSIDSVQAHAPEFFAKARYANGATLRSSLTPASVPKVDSIVRSYGLTLDVVNQFKPWFVALALSQAVMQKAGFAPQFGVDIQINEKAKAAKKRIIGLEGLDVQLNMFDRFSNADQERMILTAKSPEGAAKELEQIKTAWLNGDSEGLEAVYRDSQDETPDMHAILVDDRNVNWLPRIDELVNGKDDALVVVGAAHLIGKKGLLELLRAKGYQVEQL